MVHNYNRVNGGNMEQFEIKAGRRNSEADYQRMRKAYKLMQQAMAAITEMGYTDFDGEDEDDGATKAERYGGKPREELEDSDFVIPKERKFPVMTAKDVRDAVSSWGRYKGSMEFPEFRKRLVAIAKRKGFEDAIPAAWQGMLDGAKTDDDGLKAVELGTLVEMVEDAVEDAMIELSIIEAEENDDDDVRAAQMIMAEYDDDDDEEDEAPYYLHVYLDHVVICMAAGGDWKVPFTIEGGEVVLAAPRDWARVEKDWTPVPDAETGESLVGSAVKALDDGWTIVAQAVRFGSHDEPDTSAYRDYFTKSTDFWLDRWERRPMLYHHAMDAATADQPVVGTWVKAWVDDTGVWLQGQLDKAHKYAAAIKELAERGILRISSDSAPHLVRRKPGPNGTNEVARWPLMAASLTPTPAEPRLQPVSVKTATIGTADVTDERSDRHDGAQAATAGHDQLMRDIQALLENTA